MTARAPAESIQRRSEEPPLPSGPFDLVYADPPWRYEFSKSDSRSVEAHYPTLSQEEIESLRIPAAADSVLFLWTSAPNLVEALDVMRAWGFVYRTHMVWDKARIGMGYWCRSRHELLLIATRGTPRVPPVRWRPDSILTFARSPVHSAKPREVRRIIERMLPWANRRLELFARGRPPRGWVFWGDQAVPETGPGRPRVYHFDSAAVRRLRSAGCSWNGILGELGLPDGALRSVRRACENGGGKLRAERVANLGKVGFATPRDSYSMTDVRAFGHPRTSTTGSDGRGGEGIETEGPPRGGKDA